jgi:hypothetical protein
MSFNFVGIYMFNVDVVPLTSENELKANEKLIIQLLFCCCLSCAACWVCVCVWGPFVGSYVTRV